ncbi:polysaccharide deacetylase family protein [Devosia ginsengisoli]|uniref:ChbG/HpnK family deacetylase n=1 Tax=Devosia ginsengisoli TaxID=400770 RepID=A0A5B8LTS6_9HYPH|nr:polysaccharide deacetylase family protein [Devosia ginsengisoli]QDZ11668.1 ChbG/HpnK family deacetylase [Devosia ginsengisoli]
MSHDLPHSRFVVIHEDDLGMSHGANQAFVELAEARIATSGSVMVPCPWFPELAQLARERPQLDIGVHLTLNSDARPYRWRPLTGVRDNGLTDPDGYFWTDVPNVRRHAQPDAVETELRLQIETALAAGIGVTHLDCHMGTAMMPEFVAIYERLGADYRLPLLLMDDYRTFSVMDYVGPVTTAEYNAARDRAAARGNPVVALQLETAWDWPDGIETAYRNLFARVPPGVSWLALHFTAPGDVELFDTEAVIRTGEYAFFRDGRAKALMDEFGLVPIGLKDWQARLLATE